MSSSYCVACGFSVLNDVTHELVKEMAAVSDKKDQAINLPYLILLIVVLLENLTRAGNMGEESNTMRKLSRVAAVQ